MLDESALEVAKRAAGTAAANEVSAGMRVGLGTGSTAIWFVRELAQRVSEGLSVECVATSRGIEAQARELGLTLIDIPREGLDIDVDGADVVDPHMTLLKGRGGALVREKIVATSARRFVVVVDETKHKRSLTGPLALEVLPFGWEHTVGQLEEILGSRVTVRTRGEGAITSDNGNLLADAALSHEFPVDGLVAKLDALPGLVGHGIFVGMAHKVILGKKDGSVEYIGS